ncbi:multi antimicrobial extrusion protein MatE [Mesobacillus foraminis]|uniref:multi antimicrobial extrusion protein MatE n=1 Tax=Mesobacillus foraminis TaxID=279826 RepID=UPI000EF4F469|nr:multi antimicrobial extrusion protein MatE [Mesobacillus foraminis]
MGIPAELERQKRIGYSTLLRFFIPLSISASLVTISHVIINSTLAKASNPAAVIASYAIAMSLFGILERIAVMLRPTSAALVKDKTSFRQMYMITFYVLAAIFTVSTLVAFTPIGEWVFTSLFNVEASVIGATVDTYKVLLFVTVFSGTRCLFHGIIISHFRTKWLTIGMVVRLLFMAGAAAIFISRDMVDHGSIGAYIFLIGMAIEALVSLLEGMHVVRQLPEKKQGHHIEKKRQIFKFYWPLMAASLIAVIIGPAVNIVLGWSREAETAIAAYSIALSITHLFLSFTSYIHQIVLNFYKSSSRLVTRFVLLFSNLPVLVLLIMAYSPVGTWFLRTIMGVSGELLDESLTALRFFIWMAIFFPWLDFVNGLLMVRGETRIMSFSQAGNVAATISCLLLLITFSPEKGGMIGALSQSFGVMVELSIVSLFLYAASRKKRNTLTDRSHHLFTKRMDK